MLRAHLSGSLFCCFVCFLHIYFSVPPDSLVYYFPLCFRACTERRTEGHEVRSPSVTRHQKKEENKKKSEAGRGSHRHASFFSEKAACHATEARCVLHEARWTRLGCREGWCVRVWRMRLPGVPRGPSVHRDCAECGIPRGYLSFLFSFIRPSQTSTRRLIQRLRRDLLRISDSFLRCSDRPGVSCLADTVDGSGLPYWEKRWSRRSVLCTLQFGVFVAILADGVTAPVLPAGIEAMLHGDAHVAGGGFPCCWFVNVFSFAFAETPQRAESADSRALRGGAPHDFWRDEAASVILRCLFSGLRDYPLLECIV
ncbi:hypothetical protein TCSYLVIO_007694 [Trypanosoma cruzi]|nr:hypothetical protein TCSYLVIO_007694 [Trypanosoma cruzi]